MLEVREEAVGSEPLGKWESVGLNAKWRLLQPAPRPSGSEFKGD